jgi:Endonuclease/Exonuclease/phosphatase family
VSREHVTVMSLNTLGVGSDLAERYAVIGAEVEAGDADVACFQEVISWWHLRLLARRMRSFGHVSYRFAPPGPAGGLVTFSRRPVFSTVYNGFGMPPRADRISRLARLRGALKGDRVRGVAAVALAITH